MFLEVRERERAWTYMGCEEVGDEINDKTPPNAAEDEACDLSHSLHQGKAMIHLGEELKQED